MKIDREHIDIHVHMGFQADMEAFVKVCRKLSVAVAVNACGPMYGQPGNDATEAAMKKYPDTVIGMGYVGLGRGDTPETVADLHRRGFKGLKMIAPTKDYDDEEFFPIYARAEELNMPILFHTGIVVRSDVWLEDMKKSGRPMPPHADPRTFNISSKRMEPMCVDGILRAFPKLNCILAHFGSSGRRESTQGIIQWNPNGYGDLTEFSWAFDLDDSAQGWHVEPRHVQMFAEMLKPLSVVRHLSGKILFATDINTWSANLYDAKLASHRAVYTAVGLTPEMQRLVFRDTAARLLGLE